MLTLLKWGAACVVLALTGTAVYARILHRRDDARWKAPGRMVEVEPGRSMHIYCTGSGTPTVILEAGAGDFSLSSWYSVQPQLSALSRTCSYDRASTGWSDRVPGRPTPAAIITDLHNLLARSGEPGPYLLVGHSLGGAIVRHYAVHYPAEVAGLILVDGSHEDQVERMKAGVPRWAFLVLGSLPALHFVGVDRLVASARIKDTISAIIAARTTSDAAMENTSALISSLDAFNAEVKRDVKPFGPLPLIALTADVVPRAPGITQAVADSMHREWVAMHQEIVSRSTRGRWILAEHSGHYIQRDRPDLVIQSVREMLDTLRSAPPVPVAVGAKAHR
ncbi:MAG: alpha/beta hydrolase [Gemmatimonadetes bacterium]|nr:alpha/beta hydrolase [Gemmatimonadota bacterium]MBI3569070.1 alpha/beta hydrolase [Gemmatimonadota bacterium]